jgi:predicted metal-dependent hydrolase
MNEPRVLRVGGLDVELTRRRVRNINLRVLAPDGRVVVSAPSRTSLLTIVAFVEDRAAWIAHHRARILARPRRAAPTFVDGESVDVWGVPHTLRVFESRSWARVALGPERTVWMRVRAGATTAVRGALLDAWLRGELLAAARLETERYAAMLGVDAPELVVRRMRSRWGSCSGRTRRVCLNLELARRPPECLAYVVLHELAHLRAPHHGPAFWALVAEHMPSWRQHHDALRAGPPPA